MSRSGSAAVPALGLSSKSVSGGAPLPVVELGGRSTLQQVQRAEKAEGLWTPISLM